MRHGTCSRIKVGVCKHDKRGIILVLSVSTPSLHPPPLPSSILWTDRDEALTLPQSQKSNREDVKSYGLAPNKYKYTSLPLIYSLIDIHLPIRYIHCQPSTNSSKTYQKFLYLHKYCICTYMYLNFYTYVRTYIQTLYVRT